MRGIVLSERRDVWARAPRCLTTELPQFTPSALSMTEIQPLKFAKGDKISQNNTSNVCQLLFSKIMELLLYSHCMVSTLIEAELCSAR